MLRFLPLSARCIFPEGRHISIVQGEYSRKAPGGQASRVNNFSHLPLSVFLARGELRMAFFVG